MLFDYILLVHFKHIKAERSEAAIFHILKGRKSIQTVQDVHIFELENFYGAGSFFTKKQFDERIDSLRRRGKIKEKNDNNHYVLTEKGLAWLKDNQPNELINYFNGYRYEQIATDFYERLILFIQTLTNSKMNNFSFIPVIGNKSAENWVRTFYRETRNCQPEILSGLYKELSQLLSHCSKRESEIFVDRLSGYRVYGLSINQLSTKYDLENEDIRLILTGMIHYILSMAEKMAAKFPLMAYTVKDLINISNLSSSAQVTYHLLNEKYTISQIASKRQLKNNTIYDHIVEIAYNDDHFPVINYVPKNKQDNIIKAIKHSKSYKLKQIKNLLGDDFNYFETRLVLAAYRNFLKEVIKMYEEFNLTERLQTYFGYHSFRPGQKEIINDIMNGEDVLGVLPTGSGKSICYQLPSVLLGGSTIVVSPLISLMMDQVKQLKANNFKKVTALNSFMDKSERRKTLQQLHNYTLIYVSPELLQQQDIQQRLKKLKINLFVIDEAHCISQWGYEFRPDYLKLEKIADTLNRPPILALSATAPEAVQKDIIQTLKRPLMKKHIYPMDRKNIAISIKRIENDKEKIEEINQILTRVGVPTLIYFSSRQSAEKTAAVLREKLPQRIAYYHGGLDSHDRISIQQQFMNNQLDVICCTNAFGMGINKPDIRLIIHYHFPSRLEAYIQEAGRAGRDGQSSVSIILYSLQDYHIPKNFIYNELPSTEDVSFVLRYLYKYKKVPGTLEEIGESLKLNEIQWRFLRYQLENHAIIIGNEVTANRIQISRAYTKINEFIHNRTKTKEKKLTEMLNWLQTKNCIRSSLYENFQPSYEKPDGPCCSNCGFAFTDWDTEHPKIEPMPPESWEYKLKKLLLIGDNNEAK